MSIYQTLMRIGSKYISKNTLLQFGFNLSPMYRRSTARVTYISPNLHTIHIKLPISIKNRNYLNSIFGGSMFSAVDPFPMVQLINILGDDYVVWDKSATISFIRPAREDLYAEFVFTEEELSEIRHNVAKQNEVEFSKLTTLTNKSKTIQYCNVDKIIYIADKQFYDTKRKSKNQKP